MPDIRNLLNRWTRSKRTEEVTSPDDAAAQAERDVAPCELPPVEELEAGSDFTAFLRPEVPAALRRAALRQAWTLTPAIAGHKPLVDYDWDYNAPGACQLKAGDDPAEFVARLFPSRPSGEAGAPSPTASTASPEGQDGGTDAEASQAECRPAEPRGDGSA